MGVRIVSDSTADVPKKIAESLGITIIPLNVHFGAETYLDGVDLDADEFYRRLKLSVQLPTTSQPSVGAFLEKYQEILDSGDQIFGAQDWAYYLLSQIKLFLLIVSMLALVWL